MNNVLEDSPFVSQNRKFDEIQSIVRQFSAEYVGNSIMPMGHNQEKNTQSVGKPYKAQIGSEPTETLVGLIFL